MLTVCIEIEFKSISSLNWNFFLNRYYSIKMKPYLFILLIISALGSMGQTGPAGVGMNTGSSALKLWLDADYGVYTDTNLTTIAKIGDRVKCWKDLSGNKNDVFADSDSTKPTLNGNSPLNKSNAIRFSRNENSQNKRNSLSSKSFSKTSDITIYCVFHALTKSEGNNITPFKSTTYVPNMWYAGSGLVDGGANGLVNDISMAFCDTSIAAGGGDSTTKTDYCVKTPASLNKTYFATLQKEAWNGKLSIAQNGGIPAEYDAGAQPINNSTKYYIGSNSNLTSANVSQFFDGYIANVLAYNRLLNTAEKVILENYLSAKYNTTLLSNDFFKFDDAEAGNFDHELIGIGKALDGSVQQVAKGEGILEISSRNDFDKGSYVFIAHDGKPLNFLASDKPYGVKSKLERQWVCSIVGNTLKTDLLIDPSLFPNIAKEDLVLLIDTDNNGKFSDEKLGEGMIPVSELSNHGRFAFHGVQLNHGHKFTFAILEKPCLSGCETYFTPDGDGLSDLYYLEQSGKTTIYDRSGKLIKSIATPAYWDGTSEKGEVVAPGIYFLITNDDTQRTVTLIR